MSVLVSLHFYSCISLASQAIVQDDKNGLIITLQLIPNYELMSELLRLGKSVTVLAPNSLALALKKELEEALEVYREIKEELINVG